MAEVTRPRRVRRFVVRWVVFLVGLWVVAVIGLKWFENALVFQPTSAAAFWGDPGDPPPDDVWLTLADGTRVHAWYFPHPGATGAVWLAHGNGGNLSHRGRLARQVQRELGRSVLVFDYPGYGKSDGSPTEAGCYAAGDAAFRWLTTDRGFPADRVVLLGESLGGGVAVDLATRHDHVALVLVYTFTSLPAAAKFHKPWVPCVTLMSNRFDNLAKIGRSRRPVLVAHGTADEVIPFAQGEELFAAANEPKAFFPVDGGVHGANVFGADFFAALRAFLERS